jgi:hypothetical protein
VESKNVTLDNQRLIFHPASKTFHMLLTIVMHFQGLYSSRTSNISRFYIFNFHKPLPKYVLNAYVIKHSCDKTSWNWAYLNIALWLYELSKKLISFDQLSSSFELYICIFKCINSWQSHNDFKLLAINWI